MNKIIISSALLLLATFNLFGKFTVPEDSTALSLVHRGYPIENSIDIYVTNNDLSKINIIDGEKVKLSDAVVVINHDTLPCEEIKTRGRSSLLFKRKSLAFNLEKDAHFRHGEKKSKMNKFYALSLSMDQNYCSNRLAFEMMEKINLMHLFYSFGEININGKSQGICMIIERPEDWALKKMNSPLMIRRGYNESMDKISYKKAGNKTENKKYVEYYKLIYKSLKKYEGEELYKKLSEWIDIDEYMRWMAFNYLVKNGDYTDEVFFYIDPETKKFRIMPWDYDDLFLPMPHEGSEKSKKVLGNKLIFSSEDLLDVKIASDPYLYKKYLGELHSVLMIISNETLKEIFENTYAELYPYYINTNVIEMSRFDSHRESNLGILEYYLRKLYDQLTTIYSVLRFTITD